MLEPNNIVEGTADGIASSMEASQTMEQTRDTKVKILDFAKKISAESAMGMNRTERRKLSKVNNGIKIPGTSQPKRNPQKDKRGLLDIYH